MTNFNCRGHSRIIPSIWLLSFSFASNVCAIRFFIRFYERTIYVLTLPKWKLFIYLRFIRVRFTTRPMQMCVSARVRRPRRFIHKKKMILLVVLAQRSFGCVVERNSASGSRCGIHSHLSLTLAWVFNVVHFVVSRWIRRRLCMWKVSTCLNHPVRTRWTCRKETHSSKFCEEWKKWSDKVFADIALQSTFPTTNNPTIAAFSHRVYSHAYFSCLHCASAVSVWITHFTSLWSRATSFSAHNTANLVMHKWRIHSFCSSSPSEAISVVCIRQANHRTRPSFDVRWMHRIAFWCNKNINSDDIIPLGPMPFANVCRYPEISYQSSHILQCLFCDLCLLCPQQVRQLIASPLSSSR